MTQRSSSEEDRDLSEDYREHPKTLPGKARWEHEERSPGEDRRTCRKNAGGYQIGGSWVKIKLMVIKYYNR
ncbi:hypothetical protein B296_00016186 [Ensete ventricosum]|uniref:Uncharacterized protein n=1 Tax=Ensete ventricosum TaxID=4639 RepID=A0A426ZI40_ENSVE|nr:hypothetical protein B296_00016186 [Ensete ventricosum]